MCIEPPLPLATPPFRPEEETGSEGAAGGDCPPHGLGDSSRLTRQLSQDLFDGHTAGEGVPVSPVGGDQVVARRDGGLDACRTSFLQDPRRWKAIRRVLWRFHESELKLDSAL